MKTVTKMINKKKEVSINAFYSGSFSPYSWALHNLGINKEVGMLISIPMQLFTTGLEKTTN